MGILAAGFLSPGGDDSPAARAAAPSTTAAEPTPAEIYEAILPSLVVVRAMRPGLPNGVASGSGVIVNEDGDVLTANHVVRGATAIEVSFADGTTSRAVVAASDAANDIAVLQAEKGPSTIVPAVLGGGARVGDPAYAVGNPLGLTASLAAGVISGLDRTATPIGETGTIRGLIQFDAAVNPGSSGGPLLDRAGHVIGIVTGLLNGAGADSFAGIGFAVPIATAGGAAGGPSQ